MYFMLVNVMKLDRIRVKYIFLYFKKEVLNLTRNNMLHP